MLVERPEANQGCVSIGQTAVNMAISMRAAAQRLLLLAFFASVLLFSSSDQAWVLAIGKKLMAEGDLLLGF